MVLMKSKVRYITVVFISFLVFVMVMPGCATAKKDNYFKEKSKRGQLNQHISTTQLGRNKYYFSNKYQKKLSRYKKR